MTASATARPDGAGDENPTRRRMIAAAVASILEVGFYRTTSNEIARRAGLTWGAIQRQFGNRESLMLAAFQEEWQRLLDMTATPVTGDTRDERLRSFRDIMKAHYSRPEYFAAVQIAMNFRQDPKTSKATLDIIEQMSLKTSGTVQALLCQVLPGAEYRSGLGNLIWYMIRDFYIGIQVESATTLAKTFQYRLKRLAAEEELLIKSLGTVIDAQTSADAGDLLGSNVAARPSREQARAIWPRDPGGHRLEVQPLDFAVVKCEKAAPGRVKATFLRDGGQIQHATLAGADFPIAAGQYRLSFVDSDLTDIVEVTIEARNRAFDIAVRWGDVEAWGIGLPDPADSSALLIALAGNGDQIMGIGKYSFAEQPHVITSTCASTLSSDVFTAEAAGFTADGFPGTYSIAQPGMGTAEGPLTWTVTERGGTLQLAWDTGNRRMIEGFGFYDPCDERSILVVSWRCGPLRQFWTDRAQPTKQARKRGEQPIGDPERREQPPRRRASHRRASK